MLTLFKYCDSFDLSSALVFRVVDHKLTHVLCSHLQVYEEDRNNNRLSWEGALDFCRDMGGDLASFHSKAEEDYIRNSYLPR